MVQNLLLYPRLRWAIQPPEPSEVENLKSSDAEDPPEGSPKANVLIGVIERIM